MKNYDSYEDIINLSRPVSKKHKPMDMLNRAAQFAPFAAVVGHDDAIEETARLTDNQMILDDSRVEILNVQLMTIKDKLDIKPKISVTYFVPDEKKQGGAYLVKQGVVKKIDELNKTLEMTDDCVIPISMIVDIEGDVLDEH